MRSFHIVQLLPLLLIFTKMKNHQTKIFWQKSKSKFLFIFITSESLKKPFFSTFLKIKLYSKLEWKRKSPKKNVFRKQFCSFLFYCSRSSLTFDYQAKEEKQNFLIFSTKKKIWARVWIGFREQKTEKIHPSAIPPEWD